MAQNIQAQFTEDYRPDEKYYVLNSFKQPIMMREQSETPTSVAGYGKLYVKETDGLLYFLTDNGSEYNLTGGGATGNFIKKYLITKSGVTYTVSEPFSGYTSSDISLDTVWTALLTQIGSDPAVIEFGAGTFEVANGLSLAKNNIHVQGQGMGVTVISGLTGGSLETVPLMGVQVNQTGTVVNLTANATAGDLTVTVSPADSTNFAADDYVLLYSTEPIDSEFDGRIYGELHRIISVDTGTGVITLGVSTNGTHVYRTMTTANTARIVKLTMYQNISVDGITFTDQDTSRSSLGVGQVFFEFVDRLRITNCQMKKLFRAGFEIKQCMDVSFVGNDVRDTQNVAGLLYGVVLNGASINIAICGNTFDNLRHSVTQGAGNSVYRYGMTRNISMCGNVSISTSAGHFDLHQGAEGVVISGNTCIGDDASGAGIGVRSPATITGNTVYGIHGNGISISSRGTGSVVTGNYVNGATNGIFVQRQAQKATIVGNTVTGCTTSGITLDRSSATCTITIATPAVVTEAAHTLVPGSQISFSTTGSLPTGISTVTIYYVIADGLTKDTFQFSETEGGPAVATSGSQSGTHTVRIRGGNGSIIANNNVFENLGPGFTANGQQNVKVSNNFFRANTIPLNISNTDSVGRRWVITDNYSANHTSSDLPTIATTITDVFINSNVGFNARSLGYTAFASGPQTLDMSHNVVECTTGTFTVNLPAAATCLYRVYVIKNSGSGTITIDPNASETIDGDTTMTLAQFEVVSIMSNGTNWIIIGR